MKNQIKGKKGITLIALVVTIIVILILAGVTIATLTGDNGLLQKAGQAKKTSEKATEKEKIQVEVMGAYDLTGKLIASQVENNIKNNIKDTIVTATTKEGSEEKFFPIKVTYSSNGHKYQVTEEGKVVGTIEAGETAPSDSNATYISGDYTAVIPAGFTVSRTENTIEKGLVVTDGTSKQNEWVWIPVSDTDFLTMFGTASDDGWTMKGTSVKSRYKTLGTTLGNRDLIRTDPGLITDPFYREPDVLTSHDTNQTNRTQAEFGDLEDMATKLKDDYRKMRESLKENKGFYIGRYELGKDSSNNPSVKSENVMNEINWYQAYSVCNSFSNGNVQSRMIWGCQWDQVCRFVSTAKDTTNNTISLDSSANYGNYSNSTDGKTGTRANCKTNNIYDLAGNYWEWTQEAYSTDRRVFRGR